MRRWIFVGLLLAAASWALVFWTPGPEASVPGDVDAPDDSVPVLGSAPTVSAPLPPAQAPQAAAPPAQIPEEEPEPAAPAAEPQPTFKLAKLPPPESLGPVSALKLRFGNESPAESSKLHEQQLTAALQRTGPPPESVERVVCRRTVCRISWRWKAEHVIPFYQAVGALRRDADPNLGIDAAKPANADDARSVDIYVDVTASKAATP